MDGLILVHKPQNFTSHDVVKNIRKTLKARKVGHFGTLDPLATGLLPVALGKATRLFPLFLDTAKTYKGKIRLGFSTDTYDSEGKPTSKIASKLPKEKIIRAAAKEFKGEITQISPAYSAKKFKGKPSYTLARQNKEIELKHNKVFIYRFYIENYTPPFIDFEATCSSGTYIRSLAHDLGQKLKCGAHLVQLIRTNVGNYSIKHSYTLDEIARSYRKGHAKKMLLPLESLLPELPRVVLKKARALSVQDGCSIPSDWVLKIIPGEKIKSKKRDKKKTVFRIFSAEGELLAFAREERENGILHPFLVIKPRERSP